MGRDKWRVEKPSLYFRCLEEMLHSGICPLAGGGAVKEYAATRISLLAELDAYISSYRRTIQTCLHVDLIWVVSPWTQNQGQIDRSRLLGDLLLYSAHFYVTQIAKCSVGGPRMAASVHHRLKLRLTFDREGTFLDLLGLEGS